MFQAASSFVLLSAMRYARIWSGVWPRELKGFFWAMVPAWIVVHFPLSQVAETRLFLVPQFMVFVPGALFGLRYWRKREAGASDQ